MIEKNMVKIGVSLFTLSALAIGISMFAPSHSVSFRRPKHPTQSSHARWLGSAGERAFSLAVSAAHTSQREANRD